MTDPIKEAKDICAKLSPQYQHIFLRYAQVALTAENSVKESAARACVIDTQISDKERKKQ